MIILLCIITIHYLDTHSLEMGKVPTPVVILTCTLFTVSVICGAVFFTYLLTKVDLLEQEVVF